MFFPPPNALLFIHILTQYVSIFHTLHLLRLMYCTHHLILHPCFITIQNSSVAVRRSRNAPPHPPILYSCTRVVLPAYPCFSQTAWHHPISSCSTPCLLHTNRPPPCSFPSFHSLLVQVRSCPSQVSLLRLSTNLLTFSSFHLSQLRVPRYRQSLISSHTTSQNRLICPTFCSTHPKKKKNPSPLLIVEQPPVI